MPKQLRSFTSLTYLPVFVLGNKNDGLSIEELKDLNLLSGKLKILNLENISNGKEAKEGGIKEKQHILRLELHWARHRDNSADDIEVLQGLQPHHNLKRLGIYNYVGSKFPTWTAIPEQFLPSLVHVVLKDCSYCKSVLELHGLHAVESIGAEFYGSDNTNVSSFPSLESLTIGCMEWLVKWSAQVSSSCTSSSSLSFPRLEELRVENCPSLRLMPSRFPSKLMNARILCLFLWDWLEEITFFVGSKLRIVITFKDLLVPT
ncbi:hypothetical protein MKW92_039234 [Papaver armeniacum]|nr:hypothetical protein MKW92_039234 [Papaver armeniacum]